MGAYENENAASQKKMMMNKHQLHILRQFLNENGNTQNGGGQGRQATPEK